MNRGLVGIALLLSVPVGLGVVAAVDVTIGQFRIALLWGAVAFLAIFLLVYLGGSYGSPAGGDVVTGVDDATERDEPPAREGQSSKAASAEPRAGQPAVDEATATPESRATPFDLAMGAGLGALLTVLVWYIPGSPLLGGMAAGYMADGSREDAQRAALLAGLLVPGVVLVIAVAALLIAGVQVLGRFPFGPTVAVGIAVGAVIYVVGFSVAGGRVSDRIREG